MADRIYCLSNPAEPGLVRIARWCDGRDASGEDVMPCGQAENIDWSLEVDDAAAAVAAIDRSMRRYRKNRGGGIYRCSSSDAWGITIRYSVARRRNAWWSSFSVTDALLTVFLGCALTSGILAMQVVDIHASMSLSVTAVVLSTLTSCLAFVRDRTVAS